MILFSWGTRHDCKPSTQETEVGLLPVQGQPGLHGKTEGWGGASFVKKKKNNTQMLIVYAVSRSWGALWLG